MLKFRLLVLIACSILVLSPSPTLCATPQQMTPLLLAVSDAPVPFLGSDGLTHLVYELSVTNFSSGNTEVRKVEVLGDGVVLQALDAASVASRLQPVGSRQSVSTWAPIRHYQQEEDDDHPPARGLSRVSAVVVY